MRTLSRTVLLCFLSLTLACSIAYAGPDSPPSLTSYSQLPLHSPGPKTLRFATLEWPPYISKDLPEQGYVAELLREVFLPAGYSVELVYLPWQRAINYITRKEIAGYLPEYYDPDMDSRQCTYSAPFPGGPLTFMHRASDPHFYKSIEDLKRYRIGVVSGYINFKEFDAATFLLKDFSTDDLTNVRKLLMRRVDIIIGDPLTALYLYRKHIDAKGTALGVQHPYIENKPLYVCFNPTHPSVEALLDIFNSRLAELKASGKIKELHTKLMDTYLPTDSRNGTAKNPISVQPRVN
ncbi:transporter substrate-binding domain-containing protein [Desulfovibrio mangrovi]|uniref:substrate-binding periplasmic protein n=1 Tax=Desulfovibrio mangrovi TaxID=2976983 RepID=UPI002245CBA6|nr:transporter substrate-binding domain-containing protein [Desulfovibrio mangrovi]UZP67449.1 transporter substrate-binding domain-containing protein [Desulfovibrio mangrovi]